MSVSTSLFLLLLVLPYIPLIISYGGDADSENDIIKSTDSIHPRKKLTFIQASGNNILRRKGIAEGNLHTRFSVVQERLGDASQSGMYYPGDKAPPFTLPTLQGILSYPSNTLPATTPLILHAYTSRSAFLKCLWNCSGSVESLIKHTPPEAQLVFLSHDEDAYNDAVWMRNRVKSALTHLPFNTRYSETFLSRTHFVILPVYQLGNWIPVVHKQWLCSGHNCGLDQAVFYPTSGHPIIVPRLDARYDWLPFFKLNVPYNVTKTPIEACNVTSGIKGRVVLVRDTGCSIFQKIVMAEKSGASGVIIIPVQSKIAVDLNCKGAECTTPIGIPATMIDPKYPINRFNNLRSVTFQNTPYDNFFFSIDRQGALQEVGWFLYPSFHFLSWHAQWEKYASDLSTNLHEEAFVIPVLNNTIMHGSPGAVATIDLPSMDYMASFSKFELDMALSCPGQLDATCPHWDHTVQLFVCCETSSTLCGAELGRWISPFRRRIGRWLTDVTSLLPLLDGSRCTFTMKTVPWAMPWSPSLNLRFTGTRDAGEARPVQVMPLYHPGANFDKNYNSHFTPVSFTLINNSSKILIVSVITGHGSDENGCGEFCITSHHFTVNNHTPHTRTFSTAGTPLGCADNVPQGVEPNEHGTWLYGRDGWCDGQEVAPWVIDITAEVNPSSPTKIHYYGWFNGTDPSPKSNPGSMILYSYIVFYND